MALSKKYDNDEYKEVKYGKQHMLNDRNLQRHIM
jgi:hypothetical protein